MHPPSKQIDRWYGLGEFRFDPQTRHLICADETIHLANKPFRVLLYLIEQRDRLVSRGELLETFWEGQDVYDDALRKCVGMIRKALDDQGQPARFIETRWGEGYRYIGPLVEHTTELATEAPLEPVAPVWLSAESNQTPNQAEDELSPGAIEVLPAPAPLTKPRWRKPLAAVLAVIALLALCVVAWWRYRQLPEANAAPLNSIAVLPLKNLSGDATQEYLSDGVAESLIGALARAKGLKVIARTSAFAFKGRDTDVREIGRQLGVAAVLEGSLRRSANQWRIEVRLVNTADGQVIWANEMNPPGTGDLLTAQDEIACSVANNLRLLLCNEPEQAVARHATRNPVAYQAYLKGRYHWYRRGLEDMKLALAAYEEAIRADPQYALAYCGLAETYGVMQVNRQVPPNSVVAQVKANAQKALELDPTLARSYAIQGLVAAFVEWDWTGSERLLKRALELDPGYAYAHGWYANTLEAQGRLAEAETVLRHAIELDPLSLSLIYSLGETYFYAGQYERMLEQAQKLDARDPQSGRANYFFFEYYLTKGNYDEAARWLEPGVTGGYLRVEWLNAVGKKTEAARMLDGLARSAQAEQHLFAIAGNYALLGDKEAAFAWLQRAYERRDTDLVSLKIEPAFAALRADPRYLEMLRRIGLPE